jgi:exodeoxyribonuclease-3
VVGGAEGCGQVTRRAWRISGFVATVDVSLKDRPLPFSIVTWNINSVRLRIESVARFLKEQQPDVLCLQETKCPDANFPSGAFKDLGYEHIALNGQKGYHGVAIVSRRPFADVNRRDFCEKGDSRHIAATLDDGLEIHNFYVPAGGDEPDPLINPKFAHKLDFVDEMGAWFQREPRANGKAILVGDLNIAPLEHDVWSHKALLSVVSHTPIEVEKFTHMQKAGKWHDALRHFTPDDQKLYTWWSYRSPDWNGADKGRRLDHVWVSPPLSASLATMKVFRDVRGWERPSDHAPVRVELEI